MKLKKFLVLVFTVVFFLTSSNFNVLASELKNTSNAKKEGGFKDRVSSEVNKAFENQEFVEVLVQLNQGADLNSAKEQALMSLDKNASIYEEKIVQRHAVVNSLKEVSAISQYNLLKILEDEKDKGNVEAYESFYIVNMIYVKCNKEAVKKLSTNAEVKSIIIDEKIEIDWPEIDELSKQDINNTEGTAEWGVQRIGAPAVWENYGTKGEGVVVGVIDTGFDWTHEALKEKWRGYDASNPDVPNSKGNWFDAVAGKTVPYDDSNVPHGSHVSGTIVGQDPGKNNIIGVAPSAQIIVAKAFTAQGGKDSNILKAAQWMLAPNGDPILAPDIINNSWGGKPGFNEWFREIVQAWRAAGILPVFSSGNEPNGIPAPPASVTPPSNYPESFSVGATDINNLRGIFSRRGPSPYEAPNDLKPDIVGPGVNIRSSVLGGYEAGWDGTSMAAPHISGTAALLLSYNSALTPDQIEDIIINTATPLTDSDYFESPNYGYGYGLVNALDAVASISTGTGEITGHVMKDGNDVEEPIIKNHKPIDTAYVALSTPVEVEVSDDISIKDVSILFKITGSNYDMVIPMKKVTGSYSVATFKGVIPGNLIRQEGFQYKIRVIDFGNNVVETNYHKVNVTFGEKPEEVTIDFSEAPNNWFMIDGDWEWGIPTGIPNKGDNDKVMATKLAKNYSDNSQSYLVTPLLDLRDVNKAYITFDHFYQMENSRDKGIIAVTKDYGKNWTVLREYTDTNNTWEKERISLDAFAGSQTPVLVAFIFLSDSSISRLGWYIDNFGLYSIDNIAPDIPQNLTVETTAMGPELKWDPIEDRDSDLSRYNVYRSTTSQSIDMSQYIGSSSTNKYSDSTFIPEIEYNYFIKSIDQYNNESEKSNIVSVIAPKVEFRYENNFENDDGNIIIGGTKPQWEWGIPVSGPNQASSGSKLWATKLAGQYDSNTDSWIQLPPVSLDNTISASLGFNYWLKSENRFDKAFVEIKNTEDSTWQELGMYMGEKSQGEEVWKSKSIDLSEYLGQTVHIRFRFKSDISGDRLGWYIDDVKVSAVLPKSANENNIYQEDKNKILEEDYYEDQLIYEKDQSDQKDSIEYVVGKELLRDTSSNSNEIYYTKDNIEEIMTITGVPVDAIVSILETGKLTKVNLIDGMYKLHHPANKEGEEWTIKVDSYGYDTILEKIVLEPNESIIKNYKLNKSPSGKLKGTLVNERNNEPIAGAFVKIMEDPRIVPVITDAKGEFIIENILTGIYTLKISHAEYTGKDITLDIADYEEEDVQISLKPFIGYGNEMAYDDGTAEDARAMNDSGNGWAVKFTPDNYGALKSVNVSLYNDSWPEPGGNRFKVLVFHSNEAGEPSDLVFVTDVIEGVRGQWNKVDVSKYGFVTNKDFYVVMQQVDIGSQSPGMCMDQNSSAGRSYGYQNGTFVKLEEEYGNIMMRANVEYSLDQPIITSMVDGSFFNTDNLDISGIVNTDCTVKINLNGVDYKTVDTKDHRFTVNIPLIEGKNVVKATAIIDGKETDARELTVNRDMIAPIINITSPKNTFETNLEVITITGSVNEANLDKVIINNEEITLDKDSTFKHKLILNQGENLIAIKVVDKADNESMTELTGIFNGTSSKIIDITPAEDITVVAGDKVKVSFRSELQGGKAYFGIQIPLVIESQKLINNMVEVKPGYYEGEWIVPEALSAEEIIINVKLVDKFGNETLGKAPGKIKTFDKIRYVAEILSVTQNEEFGVSVINAEIKNICNKTVAPTLIIMVTDKDNKLINISSAKLSELSQNDMTVLGSGFRKPAPGEYTVKAFVWNSFEDMKPLAEPIEQKIIIK